MERQEVDGPRETVFDRGQVNTSMHIAPHFDHNAQPGDFHRTAADRKPCKRTVTAQMMGDPKPGRSAQDKRDADPT